MNIERSVHHKDKNTLCSFIYSSIQLEKEKKLKEIKGKKGNSCHVKKTQ